MRLAGRGAASPVLTFREAVRGLYQSLLPWHQHHLMGLLAIVVVAELVEIHASWITLTSAFSTVFLGFRKPGK